MRRLLQTSLIIGLLYIATTVAPALAGSCTERQQVCYAYCEKTMPNSPGCRDKCGEIHRTCLASGCWESRVAAKRCGFTKQ